MEARLPGRHEDGAQCRRLRTVQAHFFECYATLLFPPLLSFIFPNVFATFQTPGTGLDLSSFICA